MLSPEKYIQAIELTQLVSMDLIVKDTNGKVLLGRRVNDPAKGKWFVPGCRLFKEEPWTTAITRVAKEELGIDVKPQEGHFMGVYDHFYGTNFMNKLDTDGKEISTH